MMKRTKIWMLLVVVLAASATAQTIPYEYVTEFSTPSDLGEPLAIAVDSNGGVYYTLLATAENNTGCFYVANPFDAPAPEDHILVDDGLLVNVPAGRGIVGVDVDEEGNVFLAMESGTGGTSSITKHGPAPTFDWMDDFGNMAMVTGQRYNGVVVLPNDLIAVTTFTNVQFLDSNTGEILRDVSGGESYQRDITYNPNTHELYISKNGGNSNNGANLLTGGSPDNLEGYAEIQPAFIAQGGNNGTYGIKNQKIGYDKVNDLILITDASDSPTTIAVYRPGDLSAPAANIHGYQSPEGPLFLPADAAAWTDENGDTFVFVTDSSAYRIVVFKMGGEGESPEDIVNDIEAEHPFTYVTDFETAPDTGAPFALAADADGGLYYTLFSTPNPNTTGCYYIADPMNANGVENHILVNDGADTDVPANRGFLGVAVDDEGSIYLALETGQAVSANVRKIQPAPNFGLDTAFGGGIIYYGKRINAVEYVGSDTLAVSTFDTVEFLSSSDGASKYVVGGAQTYQRDLAYNPNTGDIYLARNRQVPNEPLGSVNLLSGGNVDNLGGYTEFQNHFVPQGGIGGTYGANNQLIEYDAVNNQIIVPDYSGTQAMMAFYDPADPESVFALVDGSESDNGPFDSPADAVVIHTAQDETFVYISDMGLRRIFVYQTRGATSVDQWDLF
ncbi:MAG: hypothetical protein JXR73_08505 [Candidatus Omnitrophica bacterium]|nr:hypothetical protein [Candidatus Omnitrophota bacterium]